MSDSSTAGGSPAGRIRVLLVDDQPLIRLGFRMVLESEPDLEIVGEAQDGGEAFAIASELVPDVVVMDVRMPGLDGIAATARIAERLPGVRVLIVTTYDLDEYAFEGLRAGASGFLVKNAPPADLVRAIRTVAAGDAIVEPRITRRLLELFAGSLPVSGSVPGAPEPTADAATTDAPPSTSPPPFSPPPTSPLADPRSHPRLSSLTEREAEVFTAIARGMSNTEITAALHLSESTVKTYVGRILMKLGLRDRIQAVVLGYETGVVAPGSSAE